MSKSDLQAWLSARSWSADTGVHLESFATLDGVTVTGSCNTFLEILVDECSSILVFKATVPTLTGPGCSEQVISWQTPITYSDEPNYSWVFLGQDGNDFYYTMEGISFQERSYYIQFLVQTSAGYTRLIGQQITTHGTIVSLPSLDECATQTTLSSIRNWLDLISPIASIGGRRAWIECERDIVVDVDYTFDNVLWIMGAGSSMTVESGIALGVQNSEFSPGPFCGNLWEGIEVMGTGSISVDGSVIENARRALFTQGGVSGIIAAAGSTFRHNFYSVWRHESSTELRLSGNNFDGTLDFESLRCDPWYGPSIADKTFGAAAVFVEGGSPVSITDRNAVRNYANGFYLQRANGTIQNQFIYNAIDPTHRGEGGHGIRVNHTSSVARSELNLSDNTIYLADYGISFDDQRNFGRVVVASNTISQAHIGVRSLLGGNSGSLQMDIHDNTIAQLAAKSYGSNVNSYGVWIDNRDQYPSQLRIFENTIDADRSMSTGIYALNSSLSDAVDGRIDITDNEVRITGAGDFRGINLQRAEDSVVLRNEITQTNSNPAQGITIEGGRGNLVCDNTLVMSPNAYQGILVRNVSTGSVTHNDISGGRLAINMEGNCLPHNIARNIIRGTPQIGIYHGLGAGMMTTDNQEGKLNEWVNFNTYRQVLTEGSEVYVVSIPLSASDQDDWDLREVVGNTDCATTNGRAREDFTEYGGGEKEIVEAGPETPAGIVQLKRLSLYSGLLDSPYGYASEFDAFVNTESQRMPGVQRAVDAVFREASPSSEQLAALNQYAAEGDQEAIANLQAEIDQAAAFAKTQAHQLVAAFSPALPIDQSWKIAMLASLSDVQPTAENLLLYRQLGEACFLDDGLTPALYAALYTRHTGTVISGACPSAEPDVQQLRFVPGTEAATVLSLRPTLVTDYIQVIGLTDVTEVKILGLDGRHLRSISADLGGQVHVGDLAPGMYFTEVPSQGVSLKFVKQ